MLSKGKSEKVTYLGQHLLKVILEQKGSIHYENNIFDVLNTFSIKVYTFKEKTFIASLLL